MLTAKTESGKTISLLNDWDSDDLLQLNKQERLFCPVCETPVLIRTGEKKRWHFAHENLSDCGQSEPESDYHLQGKDFLYQWLRRERLQVRLEPYFSSIKQRPDLFVLSPDKIPIEFQCATMSDKLFTQRTNGYLQQNMTPIWILGGNRLNRIDHLTFRLNRMDWLALRETNTSPYKPYLIYYCPHADQFALLSNLVPYSTTKMMATVTYLKREVATWDDIFSNLNQKSDESFLANWLSVKKHWRSVGLRFRSPAASYVNKMLRSERSYLRLFPSEAGIPVRFMYWIETPAFLWQTWLLLLCIHPLAIGKVIHFRYVYESFQRMLAKEVFSTRQFPLVKQTHYSFAIMDYLLQLVKIGVLKRVEKQAFVKTKEISFPHLLREATKMDEQIQSLL